MADGEAVESDGGGDVLAAWANEPEPAAKPKEGEAKPAAQAAPAGALAGDKPAETGEQKPAEEKPPPKRTYKQKVNGAELELDAAEVDGLAQKLGLPPQEILSAASLKRAAYQNMQEASKLRKEAEQAIELIRKDPFEAARRAGLDSSAVEELIQRKALELYQREIDPSTGQPLTPEQRQALDWKSKAEAADKEKAEREKGEKTREEEQTAEQMRQRWVRTIVGKLEASKLPKSMTARVAGHMSDLIGADRSVDPEDVVDDAAQLALEDVETESAAVFSDMPWETLRERHATLVEKVRAGLLADFRARKGAKEPAPGRVQTIETPGKVERGPKTITDVNGFLKGWARGA